jgi:hypothetical protein
MSSCVVITCDCTPKCDEVAIVDGVHTDNEARIVLDRKGWSVDTLPGGDTVDAAPGHTLRGAA